MAADRAVAVSIRFLVTPEFVANQKTRLSSLGASPHILEILAAPTGGTKETLSSRQACCRPMRCQFATIVHGAFVGRL
jgi:hypothetical protein